MGRPVLFARRNHDRDRSDPGVSPDGSDIFRMKIDGSNLFNVTHTVVAQEGGTDLGTRR